MAAVPFLFLFWGKSKQKGNAEGEQELFNAVMGFTPAPVLLWRCRGGRPGTGWLSERLFVLLEK